MFSLWRQVPEDTRYLPAWIHSLLPGHFPLIDERPWITFKAIGWLQRQLGEEMKVFEYGSGGSTLFFARRTGEVHAVEHDESYYELVAATLAKKHLDHCHYHLVKPIPAGRTGVPYGVNSHNSFMHRWLDFDFSDYVKAIDRFPDGYFDLVLIDGRARASCILRSLPKIKAGGWLLLDNSERAGYEPGRQLLQRYPRTDFFGLVPSNLELYQTTVWRLDDAPADRERPAEVSHRRIAPGTALAPTGTADPNTRQSPPDFLQHQRNSD